MRFRQPTYWVYAVAGVALLALILRSVGLDYGLPAVYNPDETAILNRALALRNDLQPQNFVYPSLYFYCNMGVKLKRPGWRVEQGRSGKVQ